MMAASCGNRMNAGIIVSDMAKPSKKPKREKPKEIETDPGAWERFEHAVDAAVKSGPKHRTTTDKIVSSKPNKPPPRRESTKLKR